MPDVPGLNLAGGSPPQCLAPARISRLRSSPTVSPPSRNCCRLRISVPERTPIHGYARLRSRHRLRLRPWHRPGTSPANWLPKAPPWSSTTSTRHWYEVVTEIVDAGGQAVGAPGSVTDPALPDTFVSTAVDTFGDLPIVVNNAGYTWDDILQKATDEQWEAIPARPATPLVRPASSALPGRSPKNGVA